MHCDLCLKENIQKEYPVPTTKRGLTVYICKNCGLVQSFPKIDQVDDKPVAVSGDADWGNVRYGKGFVMEKAVNGLKRHVNLTEVSNCLDIGSNRGSFLISLSKTFPKIELTGIEPDTRVINEYKNNSKIRLITERFENAVLEENYFELVYSSHTLEHLKSPKESIKKTYEIMKNDGILYLEVPNIEIIKEQDMIEEWFIDKHIYHFSVKSLEKLLESENFEIIDKSDTDKANVVIIAKKKEGKNSEYEFKDDLEFEEKHNMITNYVDILQNNLNQLKHVGNEINELAKNKKIVIWGAGRILDRLVTVGELDVSKIHSIVDKFLPKYVDVIHGQKISNKNEIDWNEIDTVLICSRIFFNEIKSEVKELNKNLKIVGFHQYL